MAVSLKLAFQDNTDLLSGNWNSLATILAGGDKIPDMIDGSTGLATGISLGILSRPSSITTTGLNVVGSADAAWVDNAEVSRVGHSLNDDGYYHDEAWYSFERLNDSKEYDIEVFGSLDPTGTTGDAILEVSTDGWATKYTLDTKNNSTQTVKILATSPSSSRIKLNIRRASGSTEKTPYSALLLTEVLSPNTLPVADDTSFTIESSIQDNEVVGTFTATDLGGTIASYSIDGTIFSIRNAGVITVTDSSTIVDGMAPILTTVTATDNEGGSDTATVTINVISPLPSVTSVTPVEMGGTTSVTVAPTVNLLSASSVVATYGGITVPVTVLTTNSFSFTAPASGLRLGSTNDLVVTMDAREGAGYAAEFLPPNGYTYTTLLWIDSASWLSDPAYTGNAGGDVNNIGADDQIVVQTTTKEQGTSVTIDSTGIISMPTAVTDGVAVDQTVDWFYLEAQEDYAASNTQALTLSAPPAPVILQVNPSVTSVEASAVQPVVSLDDVAIEVVITPTTTTTVVAAVTPQVVLPVVGLTITPSTTIVEISAISPTISLVFLPTTLYVRSFTVGYNQ